MQRSRLLRVSKQSPPGTEERQKRSRNLPLINFNSNLIMERSGRKKAKAYGTVQGQRFSSQPAVSEAAEGPKSLYKNM